MVKCRLTVAREMKQGQSHDFSGASDDAYGKCFSYVLRLPLPGFSAEYQSPGRGIFRNTV